MFYDFWLEGQWLWNTPLLAGLICIAVLYGFLLLAFTQVKIYQKQPQLFFLSLVILYVTIGSPFAALSHLSFSLHMLQMSILFFIIPPLFLLGIPASLLQQFWTPPTFKGISQLILSPLAALYAFGALFLMYHLPVVLTLLSQHSFVHNGYLFGLFIMSFSMWRPMVRGLHRRYAFLSGLVLMPACFLFILNAVIGGMNNPFPVQMIANLCISPSDLSSINILPSPFNSRYDQIIAGILMLGMHKFALFLTVHLGNKVQEREWGGSS
ncbi:cytochrome c oxidase assembly protein [Neobacillus soli]|uniref:cytochrome c oxidase assembly protein n=1 Tax=Neobacillus soli TaxID=220688 RepID=UPI0008252A40|nr:cytochrome c oxidase assembly protein [Neobacillus soli]